MHNYLLSISKIKLFFQVLSLFLFVALATQNVSARTKKCATMDFASMPDSTRTMFLNRPFLAKKSADPIETYETIHFSIHYKRTGSDAIILTPTDETGKTPAYILEIAKWLEVAWSTYVDNWGMRQPPKRSRSFYFNVSNNGKYGVDVGNIGDHFTPAGCAAYYAVTMQPPASTILFENDFRYKANCKDLSPLTMETPTSDTSFSYNYFEKWQLGVAVTAVHEFYHSIQFAYTPSLTDIHIWYEASATSMEEQLAPDVNDYWQYLDEYFFRNQNNFFSQDNGNPAGYSKSILPLFMTKVIGSNINKTVWEFLGQGDTLPLALNNSLLKLGTSMQAIFPQYAKNIAYTQNWNTPPFESISNDRLHWPIIDSIPLSKASLSLTPIRIEPLGFAKISLPSSNKDQIFRFALRTGAMAHISTISGSDTSGAYITEPQQYVSVTSKFSKPLSVLISNPDMYTTSEVLISPGESKQDTAIIAYPNPLFIGVHYPNLFFTRIGNVVDTSHVQIVSEWGQSIAHLALKPDDAVWSWNLQDSTGNQVKPGVYFLKIDQKPWQPVVIGASKPKK